MKKFLFRLLSLQTGFFLVISIVASFFHQGTGSLFLRIFLLTIVSFSTNYVLTLLFKTKLSSSNNVVSYAFFLFLITDPQTSIFLCIFALILIQILDRLLGENYKNIFNAFTLGLFLTTFLGLKISWWGIDTSTIVFLIIILFGLLKSYKENTLRIVGFYIASILLFSFIFSLNTAYSVKQIFVPGFIFFTLFILPLSVNRLLNYKNKIIYCITSAFIALTSPKFGIFTDPLITSIVIADFIFFSFRFLPRKT